MEATNKLQTDDHQFLGHPRGLYYLFFAELWERFSFYGMRALLTLYMVEKVFAALATRDVAAAAIYASYGSLVYALMVVGGRIADSMLGFRRSIYLGGILMMVGHFMMALIGNSSFLFFQALALIAVGNGFFKPNISSFVGTLYKDGDPRKDSGFTIFYMGINIGAFVSPLLCGWLGSSYGWEYGFSLAGVGMLAGLLFFYSGERKGIFSDKGLPPEGSQLHTTFLGIKYRYLVTWGAVLFVPVVAFLMSSYGAIAGGKTIFGDSNIVNVVFQAFAVAVAGYMVYILYGCTSEERKKIIVILFLSFFIMIFWGLNELSGSVLTLFAERNVQLTIMNAAQTNSLNPLFVIVLSVPVSMMWVWLDKHKLNPRTPYKFAFGIILLGLSFLFLGISKGAADINGKVPFSYLLIMYFIMELGEVFCSPVGLSKITDLSPKRLVGFMMGIWFLSSTYSFQIVGFIGKQMAVISKGGTTDVSGPASLEIYSHGFMFIAYYTLGAGLLVLLLAPFIKRWMGDVH
jgi:proton-dependent oligopeptide transporter, POT family